MWNGQRTVKDVNCFSINSIADIKNLLNEFKNKKVLITGATGGIGNNLVETFDNLGAIIVATGTNEEKLNDLKKDILKFISSHLNFKIIKKLKAL